MLKVSLHRTRREATKMLLHDSLRETATGCSFRERLLNFTLDKIVDEGLVYCLMKVEQVT